jgi:regulator of replication initiation timing
MKKTVEETYRISYWEDSVSDLTKEVNNINDSIIELVDNLIYDLESILSQVKETIEDINEFRSDNEHFRDELDSEKTKKKFDKWEKTLNEDLYDDLCQKFFDKLYEKYPRYVADESFHEEEVEKDYSKAWNDREAIEENLKKLYWFKGIFRI